MLRNSADRYGLVTKCLHWSIALLILTLIALGWYMVDLTYFDRWYNASLSWHRILGLVVLALAAVFVIWKALSPSPAYPASIPRAQQMAATGVHHFLVLLMFLIPLTGYVISTSAGKAIDVFGWFQIPALFAIDTTVRDIAIQIHFYAAYGIGLLALGHAAAALKHQFIDGDGILKRMLWG